MIRPSGSGKTSLLDVIAKRVRGKKCTVTGSVLFNGKQERRQSRSRILSYVAQEDALFGTFTVKETLWYAARFEFGYSMDKSFLHNKVETLIDGLGLRNCENTIVGTIFQKGLSGGQTRRLSVGVELVRSPSIILLDEPTTGLDSVSAYAIMEFLHSLAGGGHTIVCTIHQPSSEIWSRLDKLMLMAQGKVVYEGETNGVVPYFASVGYPCPPMFNPADFVIGLVLTDFAVDLFTRPESLDELFDAYKRSDIKENLARKIASETCSMKDQNIVATASIGTPENGSTYLQEGKPGDDKSIFDDAKSQAGFFSDLVTLSHRSVSNLVRNPGIIAVRLVMYIALGVLLGLTFRDVGRLMTFDSAIARANYIFFIVAFWVFMSVAVIPFIEMERAVFLREKRNGAYTAGPYVGLSTTIPIYMGS